MGKLLLCTDLSCANKIKEGIHGFTESGTLSGPFGNLTVFHKIRFQTQNIYSDEQGFAAGTGTFLFNGKMGREALREIYEQYNGDLSIRTHIIGSYCIVLSVKGKVHIFVDEGSTYDVYYHLSDNGQRIILTNTFYHVAKGLNDVSVAEDELIGSWFRKIIDRNTPIKNVFKLMGQECLVFEDNAWHLKETPVVVDDDNLSVPQKARELYRGLEKVFSSSGVFMTGGQDSRLSLALMLALGMKPTLYYGIGNSSNTSTKTEDYNIVSSISKEFELPIQMMNWNDAGESDHKKYIEKYGELFTLYSVNENIFQEFETKISSEFLALGYFGEVYRTIEPIEAYSKDWFTLDEFLDDLYLHDCTTVFADGEYANFKAKIKAQFQAVCKARNIDEEHISKNQFQILNTVYRQRWDTPMNNFANQYLYSFPLFGNIQLIRKTEAISYDAHLNSKHLMECIHELKPEVLEIPFFSHIKVKKYNPATHELTNKEYVSNVKDIIRSMIHSEWLMRLARSVYYTLRGDHKGRQEIAQQYEEKKRMLEQYQRSARFDQLKTDEVFRTRDARDIHYVLLLEEMLKTI